MSGFGGVLSGLANATGAIAQGTAQGTNLGNQQNVTNLMDLLGVYRARQQDAMNRALAQSKMTHEQAMDLALSQGSLGAPVYNAETGQYVLPTRKPGFDLPGASSASPPPVAPIGGVAPLTGGTPPVPPRPLMHDTGIQAPEPKGQVVGQGGTLVGPDGKVRYQAPAKEVVPKTENTAEGVKQWNPATHQFETQLNERGKAVMPFAAPSFTPITTTVGDKQVVQPFDTKHGTAGAPIAEAKAGTGGGTTSALTMAALARMRQLSSDLASTIPQMEPFENPNNPINITKVDLGRVGLGAAADVTPNKEAHGLGGMIGNTLNAVGAGAAQKQLASDPLGQAYRAYMQNGNRVGLGLTEILPRPNNALLGMERAMSVSDVGALNAQNVKNVQDRRRNAKKGVDAILSMNPQFVEAMQQQDPDWINKTIAYTIATGQVPAEQPVAGSGGRGDASGKIPPEKFARLSKADQDYFRAQGRAP